jgi:hypothetical protein
VTLLGRVLGAEVRLEGGRVGEVAALVLDARRQHVIGLEVRGVDGRRRFLPWIATAFDQGVVTPSSSLVLVEDDLEGYSRLGAAIVRDANEVRLLSVDRDGKVGTRGSDGEHDTVLAPSGSGTPAV